MASILKFPQEEVRESLLVLGGGEILMVLLQANRRICNSLRPTQRQKQAR